MGLSNGGGLSVGNGLSAGSGLSRGGGLSPSPIATVPTTWDPANKAAGLTLTGSDLIATASIAGTLEGARTIIGVAPGEKKFWSTQVTVVPTSAAFQAIGIASDQWPVAGDFIGTSDKSGGEFYETGSFLVNSGGGGTSTTPWTLNSVVDWAVDRTIDRLWRRVDGGVWNAGGTADPVTGLGGWDISPITGSTSPPILYAAFILLGDGGGLGRIIGNFGATTYPFAAPAGFSNLAA